MHKLPVFLVIFGISFMLAGESSGQVNIGRFQLVSVSAGQTAGVFMIDTHSGCTWQLVTNARTKRSIFVEMDVENLHWSWGSGAQQKLTQKIEESKLPKEQKQLLKHQLDRTSCKATPVVLTPGPTKKKRKK